MARGLKSNRSGLIALLVPEIVNSFFTTIAHGVEAVANANGFNVILGNTEENVSKEQNYIELMVSQRIDGMIIAPAGSSADHFQPLIDQGVSVAVIDRTVQGFTADTVRGDNINGAIDLTRHLLGLGHRRIAFINGDPETSTAQDRFIGFRLALEEANVPLDEQLVSSGSWWTEDAEARVESLISSDLEFSAVFAANNFMAIGTLLALRRHGLKVPDDVSLVCFDDLERASQIDPFLTVMAQPAYTMGTLATQLLVERIGQKYRGDPRDVVLRPRLIVRRSCGNMPEPHVDSNESLTATLGQAAH
jgi:LacI family transcriptional regulator